MIAALNLVLDFDFIDKGVANGIPEKYAWTAAFGLVGWLDDYPTRSGYVITPVVLWGGADPALRPSPDEVLALYRVGLHTGPFVWASVNRRPAAASVSRCGVATARLPSLNRDIW